MNINPDEPNSGFHRLAWQLRGRRLLCALVAGCIALDCYVTAVWRAALDYLDDGQQAPLWTEAWLLALGLSICLAIAFAVIALRRAKHAAEDRLAA